MADPKGNDLQMADVFPVNSAGDFTGVWVLLHHHHDPTLAMGRDDKILGFFTSVELAKNAQAEASLLPGFCDHPDGFELVPLAVGRILEDPGVELR